MKKIQLFATFFLVIILCSCQKKDPYEKASPGTKEIHHVLNVTSQNLNMKYSLSPMGFAMAAMRQVESLYLAFRIKHIMSKDELRLMVVDAAHEMIKVVNQCEDIKPYLLQEGFNFKNVEIVFFIIGEKEEVFHPDIAVASFMRGKVKFYTKSPDMEYGYKQKEKETYTQALSILSEQGHPELLAEAEVLNSISHKLLSIKD